MLSETTCPDTIEKSRYAGKIIFLISMMLIALSQFLSCNRESYSEKINPLVDKYLEA